MEYFLSRESVLKWLETPSVYHIKRDDLYELDEVSFKFLKKCSSQESSEFGVRSSEFLKAYPDLSEKDLDSFIAYCVKEGILTSQKVQLKRPPLIKSPEPSLRYLELQITDKCNLRCKHCYIGDKNRPSPSFRKGGMGGFDKSLKNQPFNELSIKQIRNILKDFEEMQGLRVLISGGEPLMHPGFKEINDMLPEFFLRKILFTNGLLLNKRILKKLNVDEIQISIDGLEKAHNSLRGKGTFKSAIGAAEHAINSGFDVSISTMVHPGNLNDFNEMEMMFKDMGIKDWTVDVPCITGRLKENNEFQISPEIGGKYLKYGYGDGLHAGESGFACGLHLMAVTADRRVSKCTFYSDNPVGRIEDGLRKCWQKIKPIRLDQLKCDCESVETCRGGCRYRALLLGDPFGKDLYKCNSYGIDYKN
jgi:radical SAM protein with 4Fe4S-binding SPASM domain